MKVKRGDVTDVLSRDGETAVLIDGHALRLGVLGAAILELAEDWVDVEELAAALAARFGPPETSSATAATKSAVTELLRHRALTSSA
jgi:hypothetical protein